MCGCKGISKPCRSRGMSERSRGKVLAAVVLLALQGKGPVRKEAFLVTALFALFIYFIGTHYLATLGLRYFCIKTKVTATAAIGRSTICIIRPV